MFESANSRDPIRLVLSDSKQESREKWGDESAYHDPLFCWLYSAIQDSMVPARSSVGCLSFPEQDAS